jgi:hypothetical protein
VGQWTVFHLGLHGGLTREAWSEGERAAAVFGFGPLRGLAREVSSARTGRGPILFFGPNFAVNSNFSQFIYCSEIV